MNSVKSSYNVPGHDTDPVTINQQSRHHVVPAWDFRLPASENAENQAVNIQEFTFSSLPFPVAPYADQLYK